MGEALRGLLEIPDERRGPCQRLVEAVIRADHAAVEPSLPNPQDRDDVTDPQHALTFDQVAHSQLMGFGDVLPVSRGHALAPSWQDAPRSSTRTDPRRE